MRLHTPKGRSLVCVSGVGWRGDLVSGRRSSTSCRLLHAGPRNKIFLLGVSLLLASAVRTRSVDVVVVVVDGAGRKGSCVRRTDSSTYLSFSLLLTPPYSSSSLQQSFEI